MRATNGLTPSLIGLYRFEVLHILFTITIILSDLAIKLISVDINCVSRESVYHLLTLKCLNIMFSERKCLSDNDNLA